MVTCSRDGSISCIINKMLKPEKWQATFDSDGKVFGFQKVLKLIILGGVDPSIRPQVWEFLLGCYALSSTAEYRRQLRNARRERYRDLIKQCQMMHSSVGTGSLAYVVGSKVMDMRTNSKDEGIRELESQSRQTSDVDTRKLSNYTNGSNKCIDTSCACKRDSSSDSGDLLRVRGSTNGAAYDSSGFPPASPTSSTFKCSSTKLENEAYESNFPSESYFDFPPLPVTDLFEKRKKDKKARWSLDDGLSTRRRLRFGDEHMHSFRISNNEDLVFESSNSAPNDILRRSNSETEVALAERQNPVSWSGSLAHETEMLNRQEISEVPETPLNIPSSQAGTGSEDRVSEWLWTLHQIVVDVVRTDSHLEFYEDTKNLARMSDILAVYAWVDPRTGYCQGMSDLLSPFVVLFEDNADAFWCFEMLLRRMRENFQMEGPTGVIKQLQALWHILELTDREMFSHLSVIGAESLHFAFRMLLVLFRRELSFTDVLSMWEMMWAADFDESLACHLEENCPELLVIQVPRDSEAEIEQESIENNPSALKGGSSYKKGNLEHSVSDNTGLKSASTHPFCGLAKTFWSRNDRFHVGSALAAMGNSDDELPVFCVAAILIMNRQKIIRETHSIDDLIKIFNDNLLKIRVKRCIRTAIKLRKKYFYKLIKTGSPAARSVD
ncbi:OLC1v1008285C1 [Oldenlandia corymbosa var. corymbosa]|uniref:OLC1v1008285C1 n=1 Tax=Oldenlandia corymbosa var. corymbosa TaxID=529605 RepID=A0AAV1DMR1_OLDCO|nr:OLC1v1008285C1 [Oldenlandia corymbosa var. corymbosa]